jgi:hypothetical protein
MGLDLSDEGEEYYNRIRVSTLMRDVHLLTHPVLGCHSRVHE